MQFIISDLICPHLERIKPSKASALCKAAYCYRLIVLLHNLYMHFIYIKLWLYNNYIIVYRYNEHMNDHTYTACTLIVVRGLGELLNGSKVFLSVVIIMLCIHFSHSTVLYSFELLLLNALVYSCFCM